MGEGVCGLTEAAYRESPVKRTGERWAPPDIREDQMIDSGKAERALKEIFNRYGFGIMCEPNKFRAALFDLLDAWNCRDERIVFRNAIESDALRTLAGTRPVTGDTAEQVVEQLKRCHMTEEDARFVVRCILAARGDGAAAASLGKWQEGNDRREPGSRAQGATRNAVRQDMGDQDEARQNVQGQNTVRQDAQSWNVAQQGGQGQNAVQQNADGCMVEVECRMARIGALYSPKGKLRLYQDRLLFVPYQYRKKKQIEIFYRDISKVESQYKAGKLGLAIFMLIEAILMIALAGVVGVVFSAIIALVMFVSVQYGCSRQINIFASGRQYIINGRPSDKKRILSVLQKPD